LSVFSRRTVFVSLIAVIILSVIVRYPLVDHERHQADSYFIHYLSQVMVSEERAPWTLNPLSYFGYYPFSYPSGVPFLISECSMLTGLSVEVCVLLLGVILAMMFVLVMFCIGREFLNRMEFVLLAVLLASLAPRFVDNTYWVGSARGPLAVLMSLAVFAMLRSSSTRDSRLLIPAVLFTFVSFASHHMAVLFALLGAGYVVAVIFVEYLKRLNPAVRAKMVYILFLLLLSSIMFVFVSLDFFRETLENNFATEANIFTFEPWYLSAVLNMSISYVHQFGLVLVFAALFVVSVPSRGYIDRHHAFLVSIILVFIPLVGDSLYLSVLLLPFVVILGCLWFSETMRNPSRRRVYRLIIGIVIVFSLVLPIWSVRYWNQESYRSGDLVEVDLLVISDSVYLQQSFGEVYCISSNDVLTLQMGAFTDVHFLRISIPSLINGDVDLSDISENTSWSSSSFPTNLYIWFKYSKELDVYLAIRGLMVDGISHLYDPGPAEEATDRLFTDHRNLLVVADNSLPDQFSGIWRVEPSKLQHELFSAEWREDRSTQTNPLDSYLIYASQRTSYFAVSLPT
jgi:hypothetical protein